MSLFAYIGRNAAGERTRGTIEAESPKSARQVLATRGIITESVTPKHERRGLRMAARAALYRQIGSLIAAGFTLEGAISLLINEGNSALIALRAAIREGVALSAAFKQLAGNLPPYEDAVLAAAEKGGFQGKLLLQLAEHLEARQRLNDRIRTALIYPSIVLAVALFVLAFMLFFMLPRAKALLQQ